MNSDRYKGWNINTQDCVEVVNNALQILELFNYKHQPQVLVIVRFTLFRF